MQLPRDDNNQPLNYPGFGLRAEKDMTFDGGTANDPGDFDGTGNPATLFTVTGTVLVKLIAVCSTDLAGASATLEVGVAGNTAILLPQVTATAVDEHEIWHDATVDAGVEASSVLTEKVLANGQDIIQTVATANITAGVLKYICVWYPLSDGATVVPA